jgi:hypothetical protein
MIQHILVDGGAIAAEQRGGRWYTRVRGGEAYGSLDEILALGIVRPTDTLFQDERERAITVEQARAL